MFNLSKQTLWFAIMLATIIIIYFMYDSSDSSDPDYCTNYKYISPNSNKKFETSVVVRRKLNKKHKKTKKIHQSPRNKYLEASIRSLKDILKQKIKQTKISNKKLNTQSHPIVSNITPPVDLNQTNQTNQSIQPKPKLHIRLFFADWCEHCQNFKPVWNKLKSTHSDTFKFEDVDCTNYNPDLPYVQGLPTIAIYDNSNRYIENYEDDRTFNAVESYLNKF